MEIVVDEKIHRFYLAFGEEWKPVVGHGINVGNYKFCAIPLNKKINVSEVTTGLKIMELPISSEVLLLTTDKEDTLEFLRDVVGNTLKHAIKVEEDFAKNLAEMQIKVYQRLGEMPEIEEFTEGTL